MKKISFLMFIAAAMMVAFTSCENDPTTTTAIVEDGVYLIGSATSFDKVADDARMFPAKDENDKKEETKNKPRPSMYARYIVLKAGELKLAVVTGGTPTEYGGTLVATRPANTGVDQLNAESKYYTPAAGGTISVAEAGMYHVAYDNAIGVIVVTKVAWGMKGDLNGWGFTAMTASADFKTWTVDVTINSAGKFKFAYGGGWKLGMDNFDDFEQEAIVKTHTNFGGALVKLEEGAGDIPIERNIWTITLSFNNAGVPSATAVLKEELPSTDYSNCKLELVGNGVSDENPGAIPCPVEYWNWGYVLSAGKPIVSGGHYTWTWSNVVLKAEGFKIRTINALESGGVTLDLGADKIDVAASVKGLNNSGDILVPEAGVYTIVVSADPVKIVITK